MQAAAPGEPHGWGRRSGAPAQARDGGVLAQVGALALGRAARVVRSGPGTEDHVRGAPGPQPGSGSLAPGRAPAPADLQRRAQRQVQSQLSGRRAPQPCLPRGAIGTDSAHEPAWWRGPAGAPATTATA